MKKYIVRKRILYTIVAFLILTLVFPPLFSEFNRIEPWIMGMPFLVFWVFVINVVIALILILLWRTDKAIHDILRERSKHES